MKFRRNKKDFFEFENDRKTHVKLYKAGKQWVSSLISSIGLIRVFKGKLDKSTMNTQLVSKEKDKKSEDKLSSDGIVAALKGVAALGAVAGGTVLTANTALADTKQLDSNQNLVNKKTVNLSSGSGSSSVSDSLSTSESNVQPEASVSKSESVSLNTNTNSSSTSETRSDSNSRSESISESKSDSNSQSVSSQTTSKSESLASTGLENSQTTTGTTAKDKLQGLINQATDFVNSDAFKSSSSDLKTALAATVKQYATVMQSSTSLTEQDYQYGIDGLTLLMNEIKSPSSSIKPNVFMTSASTSSNSTYNPVSAASDDIGSVYNTTNGLRWIYGDNKVWGSMPGVITSRDTGQSLLMGKANFKITKTPSADGVAGKDHWTITFFPEKGLMYDPRYYPNPYGLQKARFGFLLTKDYTITSNVDIKVDSTNNQASFDFNPNTDVNKTDGHVNNRDFIGDKGTNGYIQETYYISNNVNGSQTSNLLQNRIYQGNSYDTLETEDQTARQGSRILTKDGNVVGKKGANGVISKDAFGTAMYMRSYYNMYASYTISFDTLHSNKVQKNLPLGTNGGAFSGVYASVDSKQVDGTTWRVLLGDFYGEESMKNDSTTNGKLPGFESDSKARSESDSQSMLQSTLQSQNESKSVSKAQSESTSTSSSLSESLSKSSSLSESTSTSSSLSESLSTSSSLSESTSTSSSLSESLSTSSSLSESLSTSSSLSESLSTSSSLSESLSTSSSLSESLSTSSSLSESLSTSSSLSESLSTSSSLSESLSTSSSLSESLSTSSSLSESLSTSSSLSESLSTSSSLSESLSTSSSLSESLSTSSSLSESLSTSSSLS
ncbi:accessory Sec-dependent serine-rich glycoprotein adhesin, partial [Ligilactobacillus salivarius]|uniref:accessory Sec-dependent serine-rich glycoprotein adhesin n=1 Tax=Ligilactobacillus salivarius TaxID=1624 RepID=UPI0025A3DB81